VLLVLAAAGMLNVVLMYRAYCFGPTRLRDNNWLRFLGACRVAPSSRDRRCHTAAEYAGDATLSPSPGIATVRTRTRTIVGLQTASNDVVPLLTAVRAAARVAGDKSASRAPTSVGNFPYVVFSKVNRTCPCRRAEQTNNKDSCDRKCLFN
jgi:hypothetical protein